MQQPRKWTTTDEQKIVDMVQNNESYEDIGTRLRRSEGACIIRHGLLGYRLYKEGTPPAQICEDICITKEALQKSIDFEENKKKGNGTKSTGDMGSSLATMDTRMQRVEDKIDKLINLHNAR